MRVFDCFAGIGGFRTAFEREGFEIVGYCEIDKYASRLYQAYYDTENEYYAADVTKIKPESIPDFDIFTGGFPCQSFSIAGKRQGFNDTRGTMFFEIARICSVKKPEYIVLENVKGLLNHDNGRTFSTIIEILSDIGYSVEWQVLNTKLLGLPQNRERVFIIGHLGKESGQKIFPIEQTKGVYPESNENQEEIYNIASTMTARQYASWNGNFVKIPIEITKNQSQGYRVYLPEISTTLASQAGGLGAKTGLYSIDKEIRRLTPLECFRLQGFPDDMVKKAYEIGISDTQLYKMAGNAVSVNVVQEIAKRIERRF